VPQSAAAVPQAEDAPAIADVKEEFCTIWPKAVPILEIGFRSLSAAVPLRLGDR